jgi:hypothetical protein
MLTVPMSYGYAGRLRSRDGYAGFTHGRLRMATVTDGYGRLRASANGCGTLRGQLRMGPLRILRRAHVTVRNCPRNVR